MSMIASFPFTMREMFGEDIITNLGDNPHPDVIEFVTNTQLALGDLARLRGATVAWYYGIEMLSPVARRFFIGSIMGGITRLAEQQQNRDASKTLCIVEALVMIKDTSDKGLLFPENWKDLVETCKAARGKEHMALVAHQLLLAAYDTDYKPHFKYLVNFLRDNLPPDQEAEYAQRINDICYAFPPLRHHGHLLV
jgi:hypothetical protein